MIAQVILSMCWYCGAMPPGAVQPPQPSIDRENRTIQPGGVLTNTLGHYLTVEGVQTEATWQDQYLLKVEKLNGARLKKPIVIMIKNMKLDKGQRYVLKGYENGMMIGTPPAMSEAAKETGRPTSDEPGTGMQAAWQWSVHFVVLKVVEPKGG